MCVCVLMSKYNHQWCVFEGVDEEENSEGQVWYLLQKKKKRGLRE